MIQSSFEIRIGLCLHDVIVQRKICCGVVLAIFFLFYYFKLQNKHELYTICICGHCILGSNFDMKFIQTWKRILMESYLDSLVKLPFQGGCMCWLQFLKVKCSYGIAAQDITFFKNKILENNITFIYKKNLISYTPRP